MGRRFTSASTEKIDVGAAGLAGLNYTYGTLALLVNNVTNPASSSFFVENASGAGTQYVAWGTNTAQESLYDGTNERLGFTMTAGDTLLIGYTKATGTATARFHTYVFKTSTWTHSAAAGTSVDGAATTRFSIGSADNSGDYANAEIWALGLWQGQVMTDSEFERLARGNWPNFAPSGFVQFSDGREFGDMVQTLGRYPFRQTARTGTTRGVQPPPPGFRMCKQARRR